MIFYVLCYGVKIDKTDLYDLAIAKGTTDLYAAVYSQGLQYQVIGASNYSNDYVVGYCKLVEDIPFLLERDENGHFTLPFDEFSEEEIQNKLTNLGIEEKPQYMIIHTYE